MDSKHALRLWLSIALLIAGLVFGFIIRGNSAIVDMHNIVAIGLVILALGVFRSALERPMSVMNGYTKEQVTVAICAAITFTIVVMLRHSGDFVALAFMTFVVATLLFGINKPTQLVMHLRRLRPTRSVKATVNGDNRTTGFDNSVVFDITSVPEPDPAA